MERGHEAREKRVIKIVSYTAEYADACVDIYYRMFTAPEWNFTWLTKENARRYFNDLSAAPRFLGFVCLHGGRAAGCCFGEISDYFSSVQYTIKEIFIDPALQGKGYGSAFLTEIETDLKNRGVENIILSTSKGIKAFGFYQKNGFAVSPETVFLVKFLQ